MQPNQLSAGFKPAVKSVVKPERIRAATDAVPVHGLTASSYDRPSARRVNGPGERSWSAR